jgi:hypothetical protein
MAILITNGPGKHDLDGNAARRMTDVALTLAVSCQLIGDAG